MATKGKLKTILSDKAEDVLATVIFLVFWPLIFLVLAKESLCNRVYYKKSKYAKDFGAKYSVGIVQSPAYIFYEYAYDRLKDKGKFVYESEEAQYFECGETIYLFPDEEDFCVNEETGEWYSILDDGVSLIKYFHRKAAEVKNNEHRKIKLFASRSQLSVDDLNGVSLPDFLEPVQSWNNVFDDDFSLFLKLPQSSKDLYEVMCKMKGLSGSFELSEDGCAIKWKPFEEDVWFLIDVRENDDVTVSVINGRGAEIAHWHPNVCEIFDVVCQIGKGNYTVVIKKMLFSGNVNSVPHESDSNTVKKTAISIEYRLNK